MNVAGKIFVVTGAGNGMGREVALALPERGAKVAGLDIKGEWLEETKALARGGVRHLRRQAVTSPSKPLMRVSLGLTRIRG